jgi:hypothetical protein
MLKRELIPMINGRSQRRTKSNERLPISRESRIQASSAHREGSDQENRILSIHNSLGTGREEGIGIERMEGRIMKENHERTTNLEFGPVGFVKEDQRAATKRHHH